LNQNQFYAKLLLTVETSLSLSLSENMTTKM